MATEPNGPAPLTAADLAEYRANLEKQRDLAAAAFKAPMQANQVCQHEYHHGLEVAYNYALAAFDDLTADVVTFSLVDGQDGLDGEGA